MATPHLLLRFLTAAVLVAALILTSADAGSEFDWMPVAKPSATCQGSIAECMVAESEFEMESESTRRILQTTRRYISYGALQANNVPCSRRGASYYNCQPGAQANPYTRTCSAATQCRS